jgi:O-antigen/teichoic acid export membrane protein
MAYDERIKLEALRDHFEVFSKGANYLMVGHAAGLAGCLSVAREHPDLSPPLHQIGLLVLLFGAGLLLGSTFWAISMMIKISVTQAIISQTPPSRRWLSRLGRKLLGGLGLFGLWGSWLAFVVAVGLIMFQFRDALPDLLGWWRLRPH